MNNNVDNNVYVMMLNNHKIISLLIRFHVLIEIQETKERKTFKINRKTDINMNLKKKQHEQRNSRCKIKNEINFRMCDLCSSYEKSTCKSTTPFIILHN